MKRLNSKGFTLIEVIFSLGILVIIFIALSSMHTTIINAYGNSKEQFNATMLAQSQFEKIKALPVESTGQSIIEADGFHIIVDIEEMDKYEGILYKIVVLVTKEDETLERIEGYKLINGQGKSDEEDHK